MTEGEREYCPWCGTYRVAVKHEHIRDLERTIEYRCQTCYKTIRIVRIPTVKPTKQ